VARLMAIGYGGQVLLSGATRELAHSDLPSGVSLSDLGSHRLKDLTEPEQVWQLTIQGLLAEFPPLKSLDTLPNNLPMQVTSFRGRDHDLEGAKKLLAAHRLLTLVGAGGIGKTRLAMQVGADVLDHYADGVWLVDFAPITDPELVSSVIAKVVGMSQVEGRRVDESISQWLKRKTLLLILDNCEHLLGTVAILGDAIHRNCPQVRILATSRQALGVSGEQVVRLPSLDVPHKIADLTPAAVLEFGAVALFVDRAKSVDASFALTDDTAPIVADICRRLDGIPLAIELAAARVKVLSIPNLAQRLNERFKILTGGSRTALPRQKTLSALIDWSYDLLTPQEQMLFMRAAIFAGGFSLDAATAVCGGDGLDEIEVLDLLSSLTDKSLVVADTAGEQERYHLLESTRAYALEKLTATGERDRLARRHAEYFRDQAQEADKRYGTGSTAAWLASVEMELDNYRAVLEWALKDGRDAVLGGAVAGALGSLWSNGGLTVEGRYWIGLAQACLDESAYPQVAARMWRTLGGLSSGKRKHDCAEHALALCQSVGDGYGAAWALTNLAFALYQMGRLEEASETNARALAAMRELGDKPGVGNCLTQQANLQSDRGDVAGARELFAQALATYKALGNEAGSALVLGNLAEAEFVDGKYEQALRLAGEAREIDARGKNANRLATNYCNGAAYRIALGDLDGARGDACEALRWARQAQHILGVAIAFQHLALLAALRGESPNAAGLIGYVNALFRELGMEREPTEKWCYEKLMATLREQLSEAEIQKLAAEGAAWSEDQAVEEALKV
jgi:predicted ATPase